MLLIGTDPLNDKDFNVLFLITCLFFTFFLSSFCFICVSVPCYLCRVVTSGVALVSDHSHVAPQVFNKDKTVDCRAHTKALSLYHYKLKFSSRIHEELQDNILLLNYDLHKRLTFGKKNNLQNPWDQN